jgi:gliding motility-associated lipoprotein GldH
MNRTIIISIIISFLLASCGNKVVFRQYNKMENVSWNRFDIQHFDVPVEKDDVLDFYLAIRHHTDFPFDKIWVNVTFYMPDGATRSRDYDFDLKDENGNWLGEGMGELWDIEFPLHKEMAFNKPGICKVRVENKNSKYETPGIVEVGLVVKKSENRP